MVGKEKATREISKAAIYEDTEVQVLIGRRNRENAN